jgi:hypothetical protein
VAAPRFVDEVPFGFGWIHPKPGYMRRASHALAVGGRVWLFDPTEIAGLDDRVSALGAPAGVIQQLAWHDRDCEALARRYGVPHHKLALGDAPFEGIRLADHELAVWWPGERVLVVGESVGTAAYHRTPGEGLGVHPFRRFRPPGALLEYEPEHLLVGHGEGLHGPGTAAELHRAIRQARRRAPLLPLSLLPGR